VVAEIVSVLTFRFHRIYVGPHELTLLVDKTQEATMTKTNVSFLVSPRSALEPINFKSLHGKTYNMDFLMLRS
jgi:hypothetical protein